MNKEETQIVFDLRYFTLNRVSETDYKTNYVILNKPNRIVLGYINYFPKWKKFVFTAQTNDCVIFDNKCLEDVIKCIEFARKRHDVI